jgi:hypothetical protein
LPLFTDYYNQFYVAGKKQIPRDLQLDPLSLAVWFMDDGSKSRSAFYLNTQQFELHEQLFLQKLLLQIFGFESALNRDKQYFRLRVSTESSKKMRQTIEPYVVPCLEYKLNVN